MVKCGSVTLFAILLSGCAGTLSSILNDPLHHYDVDKKGTAVYTMTGDRRTAIMFSPESKHRFCAESLPDAVSVFSASSGGKLNVAGKGDVEIKDASSAATLQTFRRTEIADVYRQMGFNTCIAWAQGGITPDQYYQLLNQLITEGLRAINTRAGQETKIIEGTGGAIILTTSEQSMVVPPPAPKPSPSPTTTSK